MRSISLVIMLWMTMSVISQPRNVVELRDGWRFSRGNFTDAQRPEFDDRGWQTVSVPHDWAIYGPFDKDIDKQVVAITQNNERVASEKTGRTGALPYVGEGWYRRELPTGLLHRGQRVILRFEGAMSEPRVFVNGHEAGGWNYGYNYFHIDITDFLKQEGTDMLAVKLKNAGESSRWYPGAGLFRKVSLIVKDTAAVDEWGIFITTPVIRPDFAKVNIRTRVTGTDMRLITDLFDSSGIRVASDTTDQAFGGEFDQNLNVPDPVRWSPERPRLYRAVSRLYHGKVLKDEVTTRFGIREIRYDPGTGFQLNGQVRKFKGVCLHHDLGPLGAAVNVAALRRQLRILKDMGCDAIRSAHNMPSLEQLELCDEMGFMFLAESFDEWAKPKVKNGYARFFSADAEKDIVNLVRATRNHPSIVMWSAGNEVPDQYGSDGVKRALRLQQIFHREDPTRPVTVGMDQVKATMQSGFGAVLDIPGLNYRTHLYEEAYRSFPQGLLLGSETASTVSSRGVYKFPVVKGPDIQHDDHQCSSYDVEYCNWSNLPEDDFILQDDKPWVIGEFVWTGFDYLGEPTPYDNRWPSRSSYFGISDLAGLPKDRYFLYRSRWNQSDKTLHILPHWTWPGREGQVTPVYVYTSYDSAELFVNGRSMGVQRKHAATQQHRYRLMWPDVTYQPGSLKVVAFGPDGQPAAEHTIETAGQPFALRLEADRKQIRSDGEDLSFVTVTVIDRQGRPCPTADLPLAFQVSGHGRFRAACNGDATSLEPFHLPTMKTFNGKLVVLVQAAKTTGDIELSVSGKGVKGEKIRLQSTSK